MASNRLEINQVCRLCLCQDEDILFPASKLIDSILTFEDIENLSGVWLMHKESLPYVLCLDCNNKLKKFAEFRSLCLKNDAVFREWFALDIGDCSNNQMDKYEVNQGEVSTEECEEETVVDAIEEYDQHGEDFLDEALREEINEIDEDGDRFTEELNAEEYQITYLDDFEYTNDALDELQQQETEPNPNECSSSADDLAQKCDQNVSITGKSGKKRAKRSKETRKKRNPPPKELCPLCGKLIQSLADHMLSHTKEPRFSCKYCSMTCSRKGYLKLHVEAVHMKRVVKTCEICDEGFRYIESYTAHMRSKHNIGESFECKICHIKFRHKGGLRGHNNRKHNEESNCVCSICGMQFQDKKGLREHGKVHSNEKPYGCKKCSKCFKSSNSLKTHEITHLGITFPCTMCNKAYAYKSLLNIHIRKCHPEIIDKPATE